jgi:hypothetical protein
MVKLLTKMMKIKITETKFLSGFNTTEFITTIKKSCFINLKQLAFLQLMVYKTLTTSSSSFTLLFLEAEIQFRFFW